MNSQNEINNTIQNFNDSIIKVDITSDYSFWRVSEYKGKSVIVCATNKHEAEKIVGLKSGKLYQIYEIFNISEIVNKQETNEVITKEIIK